MFNKAKNIDMAFRQVRRFCVVAVCAFFLITCFAIFMSFNLVSTMQQKIYILSHGKVLDAYQADRKDNVSVEARDHVRTFHRYFFTLDPDDDAIQENINRALYLADGSAKRLYDDMRESGYFANLISGNINQTISIDSVHVNINSEPFTFRCYATQEIVRPTTVTMRSLITDGSLRSVSRSDNNPHGFLIERWSTIENRDIKTVNRR
ncbi:conjugative transposon protein TraK [Pedobacter xixiisoli]|uniref:Bacteroides conjugative transposon TraK protein n=1 Tax=Pedobacter xixiisoli TaxID=1476464 RepID=A0A286A6Z8_9SPHI|nr:conjugative transposon protein TraK [Pedobacter xixiisoli]SOD17669.1 Bacteroides conjugative transposon TraK protein [Pedobacter xixiisoli]